MGFHRTLKTAGLRDINFTTLEDDIEVNFDKLFSYVPIFIPDARTQIIFNDCNKNSFTLSFDLWSTERKIVDTQLEYQVDVGRARNSKTPQYLIVALHTAARIGVPNKTNSIAVFDNLNVRKYPVHIDGVRYPRDGVSIHYASNDYVHQKRDLKMFYKEHAGGELLSPPINYTDLKIKYPIQDKDLRFPIDHINSKRTHLFEDYRGTITNARLFLISIRQPKLKMISDGNKIVKHNFK